jgi:hypothetical protein
MEVVTGDWEWHSAQSLTELPVNIDSHIVCCLPIGAKGAIESPEQTVAFSSSLLVTKSPCLPLNSDNVSQKASWSA